MQFRTINPINNQLSVSFPMLDEIELNTCIESSHNAFKDWKHLPASDKKSLLEALFASIEKDASDCARLITEEMGKPLAESVAEVKKCADLCAFYATHFEQFLAPQQLNERAVVHYEPLGIILGIMPWNFPFWQVFRFAIPALLAGNTVLLKHAPNTPQCAIRIASLFQKAGFPFTIFQSIFVGIDQVESIIANPYVQGVSLTGSTVAGQSVAMLAGKYLKKCVLELGGNDAFLITKNSNLDKVVEKAVQARCRNNGQSCVAAKRFIVDVEVYDMFKAKLIDALHHLKIGNPNEAENTNGPLARRDLFEKVLGQIELLKQKNATLVFQLQNHSNMENVIAPAIWEVDEIFDDEIFAPIFLLYKSRNIHEMIELSNQSKYGLGTSIWTTDMEEAAMLSSQIHTGMVYINEIVYSDPSLPFGGIKHSGLGKELGKDGIKEFTNQKLIFTK